MSSEDVQLIVAAIESAAELLFVGLIVAGFIAGVLS